MKTDRELLELAARAAELKIHTRAQAERDALIDPATASLWLASGQTGWNPLADDGDALRLAVKLRIKCRYNESLGQGLSWLFGPSYEVAVNMEDCGRDECAAVRRAIVLVAAMVGEKMP